MAIKFSWKGSADNESGTATFYPHTEFTFSLDLKTFTEAHTIAKQLSLAEKECKRKTIEEFRKEIVTAADRMHNAH